MLILQKKQGAGTGFHYTVELPSLYEYRASGFNSLRNTRFFIDITNTQISATVYMMFQHCTSGTPPSGNIFSRWYHPDTSTVYFFVTNPIPASHGVIDEGTTTEPFAQGEHYLVIDGGWGDTTGVMKLHLTLNTAQLPVVNSCIIEPYTRSCDSSNVSQQDITGQVVVTDLG